jgi:hypothetical protein
MRGLKFLFSHLFFVTIVVSDCIKKAQMSKTNLPSMFSVFMVVLKRIYNRIIFKFTLTTK